MSADRNMRQEPVRPERLRTRIVDDGGRLELSLRCANGVGNSVFLALWLIGWTVGCVAMAGQVFVKREWSVLLFAMPFCVVGFVWVGWWFREQISVQRLRINQDGVENTYELFGQVWHRRFAPLAEVRNVAQHYTSYQVDDHDVYGIKIITRGEPIIFGNGLKEEERKWLIQLMYRRLAKHVAARQHAASVAKTSASPTQQIPQRIELPSDSRCVVSVDVDGRTCTWRGRWRFLAVAERTFLMLFSNSIVSFFVAILLGLAVNENGPLVLGNRSWWFLAIGLIPIAALGLGMLGWWLAALTQPWWRTSLTLGRGEITRRFSIFDVTSKQVLPARELASVQAKASNRIQIMPPQSENFEVILADRTNAERIRIKNLTQGEAEWLKAQLERTYLENRRAPAMARTV